MSNPRVGLVLGAGGVVGLAYHTGVLAALENDLDWDPRTAEVVVGTSAGSIAATLLRRGVPAADLAATTVGVAPFDTPADMLADLRDQPELPPIRAADWLRPPRLPHPTLLMRAAARPWRVDPFRVAVGLTADGRRDLDDQRARLRAVLGDRWPDERTWVCAVRQRDLRRTVFGRDAGAAPADAVAASCAVPGYFTPVSIGGVAYVDGGLHSPTNAALLLRAGVDVAIVVSPMSGAWQGGWGHAAVARRYAHGKLRREVGALERAGIPVLVIQPGPSLQVPMGDDLMSRENLPQVVGRAFLDAGARLREARAEDVVSAIDGRLPASG